MNTKWSTILIEKKLQQPQNQLNYNYMKEEIEKEKK